MKRYLLLAATACGLCSCIYDDGPPYSPSGHGGPGASDPYQVGYTAPYSRNTFNSGFGYGFGGSSYYGGGSRYRYDDRYCDDRHDHHDYKKSSSSSHKKSSSSSSSRRKSSSSSSKADRAREWQKDKGGNPRAKRGS